MRRDLVKHADAPVSGFMHQFVLPSDPFPLRILTISPRRARYKVETYSPDASPQTLSKVILATADQVAVRYIARVSESVWPPLIVDTAALWLAMRISTRLTQKSSVKRELREELDAHLQRAVDLDGHQDWPNQAFLNDTYLIVRDDAGLENIPLQDFEEPL